MELPKRKPTRLKGYDYSSVGVYFVTICTQNREYFFEIHIIVVITERHAGRSLHDVMRWFKTMVTNEYICDVKKGMLKPFNKRLFQKSYHDHIIRNEKDYQKIWEYIDLNPLKWKSDCFYND